MDTGLTASSVRFLFDGEAVAPEDTPESQEMEEGDAIDVMHQQTGGSTEEFVTMVAGMVAFVGAVVAGLL